MDRSTFLVEVLSPDRRLRHADTEPFEEIVAAFLLRVLFLRLLAESLYVTFSIAVQFRRKCRVRHLSFRRLFSASTDEHAEAKEACSDHLCWKLRDVSHRLNQQGAVTKTLQFPWSSKYATCRVLVFGSQRPTQQTVPCAAAADAVNDTPWPNSSWVGSLSEI